MSWVEIDTDQCNACGICAIRCPRCFTFADKTVSVQADETCCIVCGHCVSLCPTGAISHRLMDPSNFEPAGTAVQFPPDEFMRFIRQRRSHRHFKNRTVSKEVILHWSSLTSDCWKSPHDLIPRWPTPSDCPQGMNS